MKFPGKIAIRSQIRLLAALIVVFCMIFLVYPGAQVSAAAEISQRPNKDDLLDVTFPDETHGWACGRWGTILHTSDGGKTWARQRTDTDFTLASISFADRNNGWAVGDEGAIIHTSDGGKTWKKQKSPVPFFLMGVRFVDAQKGWIVTERTHILHTEDGGVTWTVQFSDGDFILKAVSFSDALNGWAVGEYGYIYHTRNGGKNWVKEAGSFSVSQSNGQVQTGNQLFNVLAINPQCAWAVGIDGHVLRTSDGGRTWKNVKVPGPQTQLFCVASDKNRTIAVGGKRTFVWSTDGGSTWTSPQFTPPVIYGWIYGLASRGKEGFVAVGWDGAIYRYDKNRSSSSWQRVEY